MKLTHVKMLALGGAGLFALLVAPAADINFISEGTFTSDAVLSLAGGASNEVYGVDFGAGTLTTGNGYSFADNVASGNFTIGGGGGTDYNDYLGGGGSTGDSVFNTILNDGNYGLEPAQSGTLNNLTIGRTYTVLAILDDTRTGNGAQNPGTAAYATDGASDSPDQAFVFPDANPAIGAYIIGTFTATATTQSFSIVCQNSDGLYENAQYNAVLLFTNPPTVTVRQRQLIDTGWRFELGDPADVLTNSAETNVAYYPEISYLPKLETDEVSGTNSESYMETLRVDPVATHMGENVSFVQTNFDDSSWQLLNLPHDWVVGLPFNSGGDEGHGYKAGISGVTSSNTIGWYRRTFTLPASDAGQTLWLEFDGVYRNSLVWFNGHILGRNVSGYSSFYFDISQYANPGGTNVLVVRVDASRFEGWFYEGAGIYRHVWLVTTSPLHVAHWGTFVTSAVTGSNATVTVQTQINNDNTNFPATCGLISTILGPNGTAVSTTTTNSLAIAAGTNLIVTQTLQVTNAQLWSLQSPNLYQLVSKVTQAGTTNDIYQTPFGIRTIRFDPNLGLFLNGQHVQIQGACEHQDHAGVGTALPDRLEYYRIERLKEMGCNVYRTAHGPPNPAVLDACDQLGMLVLDENRRFGTNAEPLSELQRLIVRDRNHPSVFAWSMANEEYYFEGDDTVGEPWMQIMVNLVHSLDSTRLCTAAMDCCWGTGFTLALDLQGFNYESHGNEAAFHASFPNMPAMGTEDGSTFFTRGIYTNTSTYDSAYDVNIYSETVTAETWVSYYLSVPWASGSCDWSGFDYRGEPTPFNWPNISSQFGAMDTCGFAKDIYYYFQANWTGKNVLHIFPAWNWSTPGQIINVWCYSDCDAVELFLNGVSQGMQLVTVTNHLSWNVPYAAGTLQAVGYRNGRPAITNTVTTTGAPVGIVLQPDRSTILADGMDVSVVTVSAVDAEGRAVPTASNTVSFSVSGGAIIGVGNGDPACQQADKGTVRSLFNGLAEVIVQSTNQAGSIVLTATSPGLTSANVTIIEAMTLPPPAAPTNVMAVAGAGQVWLNWDNVPGAVSYNVMRSTTSGGPYTTVCKNTSDSWDTDAGLTNGTTYYYVVTAVNTNGVSGNSIQVNATPNPTEVLIVSQPQSVNLSSAPLYVGTQVPFSVTATGTPQYQWYEIIDGVTNILAGATNATFNFVVQAGNANESPGFYVVVSIGANSLTSSVATLTLSSVVSGTPGIISVQCALNTAYASTALYLAPTDSAGVIASSNWNVIIITPSSTTAAGVTGNNLLDGSGVNTEVAFNAYNVNDGWYQSQPVTAGSTANAQMMNTFWKANPTHTPPETTMLVTFTNLANGFYDVYAYLMQDVPDNGGSLGYIYSEDVTNYFSEFINFNSSSNFVTGTNVTGISPYPVVNYIMLPQLSTGGTNSLSFTTVYQSGSDGLGLCGIQVVPLPSPAIIQWGATGTFTSDAVLALAGPAANEVYGVDFGGSDDQTTANGYSFANYGNGNMSIADPDGALSSYSQYLSGGGSSGDPNFNSVLNYGVYGSPLDTGTLNNLTVGQTYVVLVVLADTRYWAGRGTTFFVTDGVTDSPVQTYAFDGGTPALGGYIMGTFTANATTQPLTVENSNGSGGWNSQYNAVLLEKLAPVTPTLGTPKVSGGDLILTGTGGTANAGYTWLTTTNLSAPINWTTNSTGTLDGTGAFSNSIPISGTTAARFFRLMMQ